jgi:uncharacterized protein YodC (DUF2158 family)
MCTGLLIASPTGRSQMMLSIRFRTHEFLIGEICWLNSGGPRLQVTGYKEDDIVVAWDNGVNRGVFEPDMLTRTQPQASLNEELFDRLNRDDGAALGAVDAVIDWTRQRMRDDGFYRRIMPPVPLTNDEIDRSVPTDPALREWMRSQRG